MNPAPSVSQPVRGKKISYFPSLVFLKYCMKFKRVEKWCISKLKHLLIDVGNIPSIVVELILRTFPETNFTQSDLSSSNRTWRWVQQGERVRITIQNLVVLSAFVLLGSHRTCAHTTYAFETCTYTNVYMNSYFCTNTHTFHHNKQSFAVFW